VCENRGLRRVGVLAVAVISLLVVSVSGSGAGNGAPPRQCGTYEYVSNFTCLIQSRAATFTLDPHEVRVGETITATLVNTGAYDLVRVIWDSVSSSLGTPVGSCGDVRLGKGAKSVCRFKVTAPTSGWRTVILGFGTTIGPAQSRDYYAASLTATPPPTTTTPKKEKQTSLSVAIQVGGQLVLGDTADARVTVKAGEEPVHGIRFTGDPLRVSDKAVKIVDAPKVPASFSLGAGGSRSFTFRVKGVAKGTSTLRSAAQGTGPDGKPVSGSAGVAVKVGESALQVLLDTVPSKLALAVNDEGKVLPSLVSVEIRLKNTTKKSMSNVSLTALFPEPVEEGMTPDQLALDKKLLPVKVGTLAPGAIFKRAFPLEVTGDGEYHVRALAQYAESATSRTQVATGTGGRFEITVPVLWFEARLEKSGQLAKSQLPQGASGAWVKAGGTVLITGKVKNLSSVKTLCLAPLRAKGSGNAGGTGPVDIAAYGPDEIAPPVAGKLAPGDDVLIGLWVKTVVDGGTRATIKFDPKAGTIDPEGPPCLATKALANPLKPDQVKVKEGSDEFEIHVDVRDPVFSTTIGEVLVEFYGGQIAGAAKGSADFFSATFASAAEMLTPANLAKQALDPFGIYRYWAQSIKSAELLAHYWETATPEQKKTLYGHVSAVLGKAVGDPWRETRANIDGAVAPWMNQLVGAYYKGDHKTVARVLGEGEGYAGAQVALNIAVAEIGQGLLTELPRLQTAFKEIGDTSRTYKTLRELPPGKLLNLRELRSLYGVAAEDLRQMASIARKHGVRIGVKGRSAEAIAELKRGSVWKPEPIKPKTVNQIDRDWLGFKARKGVVAMKRFSAADKEQILRKLARSNLSNEQKQLVADRLALRLQENKYADDLQRLNRQKQIDVGKNYRDNGFSPEDAPYASDVRRFELSVTENAAGSTEYVPKMWNTARGRLAEMTGDIDGLYIIAARGTSLTAKQHLAILRELWEIGWQHPETLTWIRNGEFEFAGKSKILGAHGLGGEAAMEIGADGVARGVFLNLDQSLLLGPREFWLDVVGGFVAR
jgi:hypothetical protein